MFIMIGIASATSPSGFAVASVAPEPSALERHSRRRIGGYVLAQAAPPGGVNPGGIHPWNVPEGASTLHGHVYLTLFLNYYPLTLN